MTTSVTEIMELAGSGKFISEPDLFFIFSRTSDVLYRQPNVLTVDLPITICGDIHGQLDDLHELFRISEWERGTRYLFLGDYVDRGLHSLNTFVLLLCRKLIYPDRVYLLRGNHESRQVSQSYGLYTETLALYGHSGIWNMCCEVFDLLPIAAVVDKRLFCVHGGLSPSTPMISHLSLIDRQAELPMKGPVSDMCWSDPGNVKTWRPNSRGAGFIFGEAQAKAFTHLNRISLIVRSHQLADRGYEWYFEDPENGRPEGRLLLVWSAPNYMYQAGNDASVLQVDDDSGLTINTFKPAANRIQPEFVPVASTYFA